MTATEVPPAPTRPAEDASLAARGEALAAEGIEAFWCGDDGEPFLGAARGGKQGPFVWLWKQKITPERAEKLAGLLLACAAFARGEELDDD